jgi:prephenate dehydratase
MKTSLGAYLFVVDLEGHMQDDVVGSALEKLAQESKYFAVLGSYPKFLL